MSSPATVGQTLRAILDDLAAKRERLPHTRVRDILLDICADLEALHGRDEIHGAVHPGNISIGANNTTTLSGHVPASTSAYISPEQVTGFPPDARSDLYSLGIVLYEMLAGAPPFAADTDMALALHHLNTPIPSISNHLESLDPALETLVNKALAKNPDERYQSPQEFAAALSAVFGGREPSNSVTSPQPQTTPMPVPSPVSGAGRSRFLLAAAVLVIAALLLLVLNRPGEPVGLPSTPVVSLPAQTATLEFISSFSPDDPTNAAWPQTDSGSVARVIMPDGLYHFQSELSGSAITSIYESGADYTDATITLVGRLDANSPAASGYGVVFRYVDDRTYHVFAVDGEGRFSLWELKEGIWNELRDEEENWTPHPAVNRRGMDNSLSITFTGGHFLGSVNDQAVVDVTVDDPISSGGIGIYLATTRSGPADIYIDTYEVSLPALPN